MSDSVGIDKGLELIHNPGQPSNSIFQQPSANRPSPNCSAYEDFRFRPGEQLEDERRAAERGLTKGSLGLTEEELEGLKSGVTCSLLYEDVLRLVMLTVQVLAGTPGARECLQRWVKSLNVWIGVYPDDRVRDQDPFRQIVL